MDMPMDTAMDTAMEPVRSQCTTLNVFKEQMPTHKTPALQALKTDTWQRIQCH